MTNTTIAVHHLPHRQKLTSRTALPLYDKKHNHHRTRYSLLLTQTQSHYFTQSSSALTDTFLSPRVPLVRTLYPLTQDPICPPAPLPAPFEMSSWCSERSSAADKRFLAFPRRDPSIRLHRAPPLRAHSRSSRTAERQRRARDFLIGIYRHLSADTRGQSSPIHLRKYTRALVAPRGTRADITTARRLQCRAFDGVRYGGIFENRNCAL